MCRQTRVNKALSKALEIARANASYSIDSDGKYVIFSDHHKGARTRADDFLACEDTYQAAINYYAEQGYTLVILGDVEELWEEDPGPIIDSYTALFEKEAEFYNSGRYLKIYGNHDNFWHSEKNVDAYLDRFYPGIEPVEGALLEYTRDGQVEGEIFMVHGNQGVFDIGAISNISRILVRYFWRAYQILTGKGRTTPAEDACLRGTHDTWMYNWADEQAKLILIAGHTHRPIWSSMTHLEQLRYELYALQCAIPRPPNYIEEAARLQAEILKRAEEHPPCNDSVKTNPCYFNTGCCSFEDGDITGIELDNGLIRLIKWEHSDSSRQPLQEAQLTDLFQLL
jgi:UDP-2,3-diacylglucosamine pyrophosphatase LpxH